MFSASESSSDDGWGFNFRHDFGDDESDCDETVEAPKNVLFSDAQFLRDLDLGARPDEAKFVANPWSIAKVNAAAKSRGAAKESEVARCNAAASGGSRDAKKGPLASAFEKQRKAPGKFKSPALASSGRSGEKTERTRLENSVVDAHTSTSASSAPTRGDSDAEAARMKRIQAIQDALNCPSPFEPLNSLTSSSTLESIVPPISSPHDEPVSAGHSLEPRTDTMPPPNTPRFSKKPVYISDLVPSRARSPSVTPPDCSVQDTDVEPRDSYPSSVHLLRAAEPSSHPSLSSTLFDSQSHLHVTCPLPAPTNGFEPSFSSSSDIFTVRIPPHQSLLITTSSIQESHRHSGPGIILRSMSSL